MRPFCQPPCFSSAASVVCLRVEHVPAVVAHPVTRRQEPGEHRRMRWKRQRNRRNRLFEEDPLGRQTIEVRSGAPTRSPYAPMRSHRVVSRVMTMTLRSAGRTPAVVRPRSAPSGAAMEPPRATYHQAAASISAQTAVPATDHEAASTHQARPYFIAASASRAGLNAGSAASARLIAPRRFRLVAAPRGDDAEVEVRGGDLIAELQQILELRPRRPRGRQGASTTTPGSRVRAGPRHSARRPVRKPPPPPATRRAPLMDHAESVVAVRPIAARAASPCRTARRPRGGRPSTIGLSPPRNAAWRARG